MKFVFPWICIGGWKPLWLFIIGLSIFTKQAYAEDAFRHTATTDLSIQTAIIEPDQMLRLAQDERFPPAILRSVQIAEQELKNQPSYDPDVKDWYHYVLVISRIGFNAYGIATIFVQLGAPLYEAFVIGAWGGSMSGGLSHFYKEVVNYSHARIKLHRPENSSLSAITKAAGKTAKSYFVRENKHEDLSALEIAATKEYPMELGFLSVIQVLSNSLHIEDVGLLKTMESALWGLLSQGTWNTFIYLLTSKLIKQFPGAEKEKWIWRASKTATVIASIAGTIISVRYQMGDPWAGTALWAMGITGGAALLGISKPVVKTCSKLLSRLR